MHFSTFALGGAFHQILHSGGDALPELLIS